MSTLTDNLLQSFILTFVPLLIVIDQLGNLPFVISLTEGMSKQESYKMIDTTSYCDIHILSLYSTSPGGGLERALQEALRN